MQASKKQAYGLASKGNFLPAKKLYQEICNNNPDDGEAWYLLAAVTEQLGETDAAMDCYRKAQLLDPQNADIPNNMGALFEKTGDPENAAVYYQLAIREDASHLQSRFNLAHILNQQGKSDAAIPHLERAIEINPGVAQVHYELGYAQKAIGRNLESIASLHHAIELKNDYHEASNLLANTYLKTGQLSDAIETYNQLLDSQPQFSEAHCNLGSALLAAGRPDEAIQHYSKALKYKPDWAGAYSNILLSMNYTSIDGDTLYSKHVEWCTRFCSTQPDRHHANTRERSRRLKIGYISPDFRTHSVAYFFEVLLAAHDRNAFHVTCYSDVQTPDDTSERFSRLADSWRPIYGKTDADVADCIRNDGIDILVDLAGHTSGNRLGVFSQRPAPLQVTYLGYPGTTGVSTIDYRLTDHTADPENTNDQWYSEKLLRLPDSFLCYTPPANAPDVSPPPCRKQGHPVFGSFNNLSKITPEVVAVWSALLRATPGSCLLIKNNSLTDTKTADYYYDLFSKHGIGRTRLSFSGHMLLTSQHLAMYSKVDVALDTFPYNGTTTTCEALWMGVPVITLAGRLHASRVGASIMQQLNLTEFIATDSNAYISLAAQLAGNPERMTALRQSLRRMMKNSPLCDTGRFIHNIENTYRNIWHAWCDRPTDRDEPALTPHLG